MSTPGSASTKTFQASPEGGFFLKKERPTVSVVIPAYQCTRYLPQTIESVLQQSYADYEIIVINDGSPDTGELEAALETYRGKIRYVRQQNRGSAAARNRGISEVRGKFIAFLDGDDYWAPDHLAKQMALLEQDPRLELVYSDWILVRNGKPWRRAFSVEPQAPEVTCDSLLVEHSNIGTSTVVVSRAAILRAGCFDESLRRCEDFDMWIRLAFAGAPMACHPDVQVFYRCNDNGLSADRLSMTRARIRVYQKIGDTLPLTPSQHQIINHRLAANEADFYVYEMKDAIWLRSYALAVDSGRRAQAIRRRWKLTLSLVGLRVAPRVFRQLHRAHSWFLKRRSHRTHIDARLWALWRSHCGQAIREVSSHGARSTTVV